MHSDIKQTFLRVVILGLLSAVMAVGTAQAAEITGKVWNDSDTNGAINGSERGISGVNIVLYDKSTQVCHTQQTDSSGDYTFSGLSSGSYSIYEADNRTPSPGVCPPTETTASLPSVTQGSIQDPVGYASSTANRVDLTINSGTTTQNFGDYKNPRFTNCPTDAFLTQQNPAKLFGVNLATGVSTVLEDSWTLSVNGIGFNVLDAYIYGSTSGGNIVRIGGDDGSGNYQINVFKVPGIPTRQLHVGDVSVDGYLFLNRAQKEVYKIDVNPQRTTYLTLVDKITLNANTQVTDWAFNPLTQRLYGIKNNGHLIEVNLGAKSVHDHGVITVSGKPLPNRATYGAIYFGVHGFMYFSRNQDGYIGRLDLRDPDDPSTEATFISFGPSSSQNDGARCMFAEVPGNDDFGDAPALYGTPQHFVFPTPELYLGAIPPDVEVAHQPSLDAKGDDDNDTSGVSAGNDEDTFSITLAANAVYATVDVVNRTRTSFKLCFWYDQNVNGVFDSSEARCAQVAADWITDNSNIDCSTPVTTDSRRCELTSNPWTKPLFATYARVRVTSELTMVGGDANGFFPDGEVNDLFDSHTIETGDAPPSYLSASHLVFSPAFSFPYLGAVAPDADASPFVNSDATYDDITGIDDEEGVTFRSPAGSGNSIFADVIFTNPGGTLVTVCAWLDVAIDGNFDPSDGQCQTSSLASGTLIFQWSGLPADKAYTTFARFRISSIPFDQTNSTGLLSTGETEDDQVQYDFTPTSATIGKVELQALPAAAFLAGVGIEQMDDAALLALLEVWDTEAAVSLAAADRDTILSALQQYLDPDGDGQVAVLAWDTLEERGTIGFYVERRETGGQGTVDWIRINNDMLPGLITAPMGGEYQLADPGARAGIVYNYRLIEQEARGSTRTYGPYNVEMP